MIKFTEEQMKVLDNTSLCLSLRLYYGKIGFWLEAVHAVAILVNGQLLVSQFVHFLHRLTMQHLDIRWNSTMSATRTYGMHSGLP